MADHFPPLRWSSLLLFILLFLSPTAQAAELETKGTCGRKFQRGILNVAFSPLEITHAVAQENRRNKFPIPWANGLAQGMWLGAIRATVGVYEVVTAPFPIPPRYEPIMHPEFSLDYLDLLKDET